MTGTHVLCDQLHDLNEPILAHCSFHSIKRKLIVTRSAVTFLQTYQLSANVFRVDPSANGAFAFALKTLLLPLGG